MAGAKHLIVGLGKTGLSIARYLQRQGISFAVFDTRSAPDGVDAFHCEFEGVDLFLKEFPEDLYAEITNIINSPGVSLDEPFLQKAQARHIPILGDIELLVCNISAPVIAITGTNGKSTVTTLVGEMLKAANKIVAVAGNIGMPVLDLLNNDMTYDVWVLELSSFQLDLLTSLSPAAATILNITPDHLDRHHSMASYIASKQHVYHQARKIVYNRDDVTTFPSDVDKHHAESLTSFGLSTPMQGEWGLIQIRDRTYLSYGSEPLMAVDELRLKGMHNWSNVLAAAALAHSSGVSFDIIKQVLGVFGGLPHRTQWVRTLNGVDWINDSKGTNVGATISAISGIGGAIEGKIVLIAGGQGKGADFSSLRPSVARYVHSVVLMGEDAPRIEQALNDTVPVFRAGDLMEAVAMAKDASSPGDVVLLSPACASFDMFRDFNHRGEMYTSIVNAL